MTNKDKALEIIDRLNFNGYINNRERGVLRRALLEDRPHGSWIICNQDDEGIHNIQCPFCKYVKGSDLGATISVIFYSFPQFCEYCGADMRGNEA